MNTGRLFEVKVRAFLGQHPGLRHEWRTVSSLLSGERLDVIFKTRAADIWATIREDQIAVGLGPDHEDFEANDSTIEGTAEKAFGRLKQLLFEARLVEAQQCAAGDVRDARA
jgi:hypothetical protein